MKTFAIINGTTMYLRKLDNIEMAKEWAVRYCDHSLEIIVREIEVIDTL
jgi:hypothetical protein